MSLNDGVDNISNIKEEIIRLRLSGLTVKEISKQLNISYDKVRYQCESNVLKGIVPKENAFNSFLKRLEDKFQGRIEYVSGYVHSDKPVLLRCNECQHEFNIGAQTIRNKNNTQCPNCKKIENAKIKEKNRKIKIKLNYLKSSINEIFINKCKHCNCAFGDYKNNKVYCSERCKKGNDNKRKDLRRRNIKRNGEVDNSITLPKVVAKENNTCYLCGGQCDYNDFYKDDNNNFIVGHKYPSLEHVVPVAKGGTHTWDNIKLAHHYCNTIKNDKDVSDVNTKDLVLI